jgi:hypothetical protein
VPHSARHTTEALWRPLLPHTVESDFSPTTRRRLAAQHEAQTTPPPFPAVWAASVSSPHHCCRTRPAVVLFIYKQGQPLPATCYIILYTPSSIARPTTTTSDCPASARPVSPIVDPTTHRRRPGPSPPSCPALTLISASARLNSSRYPHPSLRSPRRPFTGLGHSLEAEARVRYFSTQPASCR